MQFFCGPLGDHRNYLNHIALSNCVDYFALRKHHQERSDSSTSAKYKELRYFLNAVESLNNVLDYFFYEYEGEIGHSKIRDFIKAAHSKYPELKEVSDLANAYKHCVREFVSGQKRSDLPWAKHLQRTDVLVHVKISRNKDVKVAAEYNFQGPLNEHRESLDRAFKFWFDYNNDSASTKLKDL
jgi:hypothetical protein